MPLKIEVFVEGEVKYKCLGNPLKENGHMEQNISPLHTRIEWKEETNYFERRVFPLKNKEATLDEAIIALTNGLHLAGLLIGEYEIRISPL